MLGEQAQREMQAVMAADGWGVRWGSPQPLKNKPRAGNEVGINIFDAQHGGVGMAFRNTVPTEKVVHEPEFDYLFDDGEDAALLYFGRRWRDRRTLTRLIRLRLRELPRREETAE